MDYQNKVAVITGGGGGIGHGYALACLKEGMKVVLADISQERLDEISARLAEEVPGAEVLTYRMDVSSMEQTRELASFALEKFGRIDMAFNNAGVHFHKAFTLMTDNDWEFIIRSNMLGALNGMRVFIPILEKNEEGGTVINTASSSSISFGTTMAHYCMTKAAVLHLSGAVAAEMIEYGSKVNVMCVMPDFVTSNLLDSCADVKAAMGLTNEVEEQTQLDIGNESNFYNMVTYPYRGLVPIQPPMEIPEVGMTIFTMTNEKAGEVVMQAIKDKKQFVLTHGGKMSNPNFMAGQILSGYIINGSLG